MFKPEEPYEPPTNASQSLAHDPAPIAAISDVDSPVVVAPRRGRPPGSKNRKKTLETLIDEANLTEESGDLSSRKQRKRKAASIEQSQQVIMDFSLADESETPSKRGRAGRGRGSTRGKSSNTPSNSLSRLVTKAGKSGQAGTERPQGYSYSDLFVDAESEQGDHADDDQEDDIDEDVRRQAELMEESAIDADEDSEYEPSLDEIKFTTPRRSRGRPCGTKGRCKSKGRPATRQEGDISAEAAAISLALRKQAKALVNGEEVDLGDVDDDEGEEGGSTDEDEEGEEEDEEDEEEEEDDDLPVSIATTGGKLDDNMELFSARDASVRKRVSGDTPTGTGNAERDIYDFDSQSIVSDKRLQVIRRRISSAAPRAVGGVSAAVSGVRPRVATRASAEPASIDPSGAMSGSWSSNIYSAIAPSLKTRSELDMYSSFLKNVCLNAEFDQIIADLCKPSAQHAGLFLGPSAPLQSLLSRTHNHDRIVDLLSLFIKWEVEQVVHRVSWLAPVIHQPMLAFSCLTSLREAFQGLVGSIDKHMHIEPAYILNPEVNVLSMRSLTGAEAGVSSSQYNAITTAGSVGGRYMSEIIQLVITSDFYEQLHDMVSLPVERLQDLIDGALTQEEEESSLGQSNTQRLMIALDSSGILLGVALLDVWQRADVPHRRRRVEFQLYNPMKSGLDRSSVMDANPSLNPSLAYNSAGQDSEASREEQVREVLDGILDWVVLKADPKMANIFAPRSGGKHTDPILGRVHFADAFLLKPNGRRDCLLLVANRLTCHPPLPLDTSLGGLNFRVYALINESRFIFAKHGVQEGIPIRLENVHTADPDDLLEDKSLLVVPDLLFDTLRKVMLRELVTSSSPAAAAAVVATHLSDPGAVGGPTPYSMVHCTKFVILDRRTRTPLAIAFDSPVRLALQIPSDSTPMPVPWSESGANDSMATRFDRITAGELKAREVAFRATTAEYRLVGINGLLYALQIDDQRVVRKAMELLPARHETIFPSMHQSSMCALSATADPRAVEATVRIVNEESNSSTVFPVAYYTYFEASRLASAISGVSDRLADLLFHLPVRASLYDVAFRLAQRHTPVLLARQHRHAAEQAAAAAAAANPHAPPPAPVPLPEHWGVCSLCAKELRSLNGLLDHEMRHVGVSRMRCATHDIYFSERRQMQAHMAEHHSKASVLASSTSIMTAEVLDALVEDSGSDDEEEAVDPDAVITAAGQDETEGQGVVKLSKRLHRSRSSAHSSDAINLPGSGLVAGLSQVFNANLLAGRMEAPQCEQCGDYFPTADVMVQHLEICDGVSFYSRTPLPRSTSCASKSHSKRIEELAGESGNTTPNKLTDGDAGSAGRAADEDEEDEACGTVPPMGALVCGICGVQVASRDRMHRHFTVYHLQCVLCANQLPSMDELSYHYRRHLDEIDLTQTTESGDKEAGDILKANLVATIPASIIGSDGQAFMKPENEEAATALPAEVDQGRQRTNATLLALARKLMTCDICSNFTGTKHNYFFHQWVEHGVVHPPFSSGTDQILISAGSLARQARLHSTPSLLHADSVAVGCDVGLVLGISNKRFKCKFCGFVVRVSGREYLEHLMEKHNIQASGHTICRVCADLFETPEALSDHLRDEHVALGEYDNAGLQTIFRCQLCDFWAFMKGMLRHSRDVHNDPAPAIFECAHCHQRFSDRREWRTHLDKHTEGYTHACPECGRSFRLRQSLVHHINTHHGDDEMPIDCEFCGITFPKRSSLRFHIQRTHSREMAHECSMCQRRFRLETDLRRHMKETHSGAVKCEICNKICNNLRCYSQHRQKHFRTRIYQCTDCQATFKSKLAMKRHIRVQHLQLGPERFECQICGKIVTQIAMHMLIHKDARFECEYCGKRFTKSAYYNEHVRIHRGERPFECHICGKRFNKKSNLNVHVRFHEKHRDEEGNYLELKPRGRTSVMFGDASLSPEARAARAASLASSWRCSVLTFEMVVGPDLPGAFNVGGPEGAASRSCAEALAIDMINGHTSTGVDHFAHSLRQAVAPMTPSGAMTAVAGSSIRDCGEQRQQHYNGLYDDTAIQDVREQVVAGQIVTKMEAVDYMFSTGTEHKRQILLDS